MPGSPQVKPGSLLLKPGNLQLMSGSLQLTPGSLQLEPFSLHLKAGSLQGKAGSLQLKSGSLQLKPGSHNSRLVFWCPGVFVSWCLCVHGVFMVSCCPWGSLWCPRVRAVLVTHSVDRLRRQKSSMYLRRHLSLPGVPWRSNVLGALLKFNNCSD